MLKSYTTLPILAFIVLITACSNSAERAQSRIERTPDIKLLDDGSIIYKGNINVEGYQLIVEKYEQAIQQGKTTQLKITSPGGYTLAGLMIGEFIYEKQIPIIIDEYCLSACANYIFPAAPVKTFDGHSIVGLHPSSHLSLSGEEFVNEETLLAEYDDAMNNDEIEVPVHVDKNQDAEYQATTIKKPLKTPPFIKALTQYLPELSKHCSTLTFNTSISKKSILKRLKQREIECLTYMKERETAFYKKIQINPNYGNLGMAKYKRIKKESARDIEFFFYDQASIQALGIDNVIYPKYWYPSESFLYDYLVEVNLADWQTSQ